MKILLNLLRFQFVLLMLFSLSVSNFSQTAAKPARQETLLNNLKILMWNNPSADSVAVKIRIHSGSAFDPQGKEGVMSLLADNIFPNEATRDFFNEDLGGSLNVAAVEDYIEVDATAKPENLLQMLETLGRAVSSPVIDKETTAKLKTARLEKLKQLETDNSYAADRIAYKRLYGGFPYGRPIYGTSESVAKIDFADLILAKQKFMTADNATITVSGNFKTDLAYRAIRRYFGGWLKSDKKIPAAFRQPDAPDVQILNVAGTSAQTRFLTRGVARNDKNYPAAEILSEVLRARLNSANQNNNLQLREEAHLLPGTIILSVAGQHAGAENLWQNSFSKSVSDDEFNQAKSRILAKISAEDAADWYLDADTFQFSADDESKMFQNVNLADVETARRKFAAQPFVTVVVSGAETPAAKN